MKRKPAPVSTNAHGQIARAILLLLIAYGSLYPFVWNFDTPQDFILTGRIGLIDLVENVVLFLPLGALLAWQDERPAGRKQRFVAWFLFSLVFAAALQWLQKYLPRTPALSDVVFNMIGFVGGWFAGFLGRKRLQDMLARHDGIQAVDRFALLMVFLWLVAELFPLIPTLDVSSVKENIKSLWELPMWQPRRLLLHVGTTVIGLEAATWLLRSSGARISVKLAGILLAVGIFGGKFFMANQLPGMAAAGGILIGTALWLAIETRPERVRLTAILIIAAACYLLQAIWPLDWRSVPEAMRWLPFASSLSTSLESTVPSWAFEGLCFGAMIWSAVRNGARLKGMTIAVAILAFACEWLQRYLPGRTPEITSVFLALGMGWLLLALNGHRPRPTR